LEKIRDLLAMTDFPVTQIAREVGYSSNLVLAGVFAKHRHMSPTDHRRAVRDPARRTSIQALETRQ
jgi:AraC family transcriptional regulator